jgi:hypothetical protein
MMAQTRILDRGDWELGAPQVEGRRQKGIPVGGGYGEVWGTR